MNMLGIHFLGNGKISLDLMPTPEPKGTNVVVKILASGICGTDRHPLMEHGQATIPGHENAGEIVAVDKPTRVKVGDRVAINCHITCRACEHCLNGNLFLCDKLEATGYEWDGGFAEYILVPEDNCHPLPVDISMDIGALLVDVLGTAYSGVKKGKILPGDQVGVWGAGPIGLEAALCAKTMGARVALFDLSEYRLKMAKAIEPDLLLNPTDLKVKDQIMDWTEGRGLDIAYECVGNENAALQALGLLKKMGTLGIIGVGHKLTLDYWDIIQRQIKFYASRNFNTFEFNEMVALIHRGMRVDQVVTHRFKLSEAEKAFDVFRNGECGKIVFTGN
jgi:threonine dehydrogenase-like Zn-dependent dehydrogenase